MAAAFSSLYSKLHQKKDKIMTVYKIFCIEHYRRILERVEENYERADNIAFSLSCKYTNKIFFIKDGTGKILVEYKDGEENLHAQ
jgi:hypothetical protein